VELYIPGTAQNRPLPEPSIVKTIHCQNYALQESFLLEPSIIARIIHHCQNHPSLPEPSIIARTIHHCQNHPSLPEPSIIARTIHHCQSILYRSRTIHCQNHPRPKPFLSLPSESPWPSFYPANRCTHLRGKKLPKKRFLRGRQSSIK
jgi:hypothetical protein